MPPCLRRALATPAAERILVLLLVALTGALYGPSLTALFNADDFNFLSFLHFNTPRLLDGQLWDEWFL